MSIFTNIQAALESKLNELSGSPSFAWPNVKFTPSESTTWIRPFILIDPSTPTSLDRNLSYTYTGTMQVDIFTPLEKGTATANSWADAVIDLFHGEKELFNGGDRIFIQGISRRSSERDKQWFRTIVEIEFFCYS